LKIIVKVSLGRLEEDEAKRCPGKNTLAFHMVLFVFARGR
jgi:hypothetical protein